MGKDVWTEIDRSVLEEAFRNASARHADYSARQIRHALFQYQIAKLLIRENGKRLSHDVLRDIAGGVVEAIVENVTLARNLYEHNSEVWTALRQVTGSQVVENASI